MLILMLKKLVNMVKSGEPEPADQIVGAVAKATLKARIDKVLS